MTTMAIHITGDAAADQGLTDSPFALIVGMMLDQQYPMEHAFRGPHKVLTRLGSIEPSAIAAADPEEFATLCSTPPAIHRYGRSMAGRLQSLAQLVEEKYDGHAERLWTEAGTGQELFDRVLALPGFGEQKAKIFVALLAKQLGVRPGGWESVAGAYAEEGYRSVADVTDPASLQKVRDFKKAKKAEAKAKAGQWAPGESHPSPGRPRGGRRGEALHQRRRLERDQPRGALGHRGQA